MAENVTLARPYAEAAFQLAKTQNALSSWSTTLTALAALTQNVDIGECIDSPKLSPARLVELCIACVTKGASTNLTDDQKNFVRVLVDNERLSVVPEISMLFESLKHAFEGIKEADITTAFPLDAVTLKALVTDLEAKFSCKIKATQKVDSELIGGVRIAIGDEVIDASVRGKLAAMAAVLKN